MQMQLQSNFSLVYASVRDLGYVVLGSLGGSEGHRRHGHHDGWARRVDSGIWGLRCRSNRRAVAWNGGSRRLHLSPLEKLGEMKASGKVRCRHYVQTVNYNNLLELRRTGFTR